MFQTYEAAEAGHEGRERVAQLRALMAKAKLDAFLVPRADEHQGEYVPPHAERLRWISGFTGSAGLAAIMTDGAAIWVDGRYTLQVEDQVPAELFEHHHVTKSPPAEWLGKRLKPGDRLGYDPWLHTVEGVERLRAVCANAGAELVPVAANPVDAVWVDRPGPPLAPFVVHDAAYAGRESADKRREVARAVSLGPCSPRPCAITDALLPLMQQTIRRPWAARASCSRRSPTRMR